VGAVVVVEVLGVVEVVEVVTDGAPPDVTAAFGAFAGGCATIPATVAAANAAASNQAVPRITRAPSRLEPVI
jgi:hypothetical protein